MVLSRLKQTLLIFAFITVFIAATAFPATANSAGYTNSVGYADSRDYTNSLDYRKNVYGSYAELSAADVIKEVYGEVSEVERDYLSRNCRFSLRYGDKITASYVSVSLLGDELTVKPKALRYSVDGKEFIFTPTAVILDGKEMERTRDGENSDGEGSGGLDGVNSDGSGGENSEGFDGEFRGKAGSNDFVEVIYNSEITIDDEAMGGIANFAFNAAVAAENKLTSEAKRFESELNLYNTALKAYNEYLEENKKYIAAKAEYDSYVAELSAWQAKKDAYDNYIRKYDEYLSLKAEYDTFDARLSEYYAALDRYNKYLSEYADYKKKLDAYNNSSPEMTIASYQLGVLDYLDKPATELKRTLSGAILGDAVTSVLSQTQLLVMAGLNKQDIQRASDATVALRRLITQYNGLKTDEEKYEFYITCHDELSENFNKLFRALAYFYGDFGFVRSGIESYNRTRQFEILLAQLYYMCNALYDGRVTNYIKEYKFTAVGAGYLDGSYRISGKTPLEVLGGNALEDKESAEPLKSGYPASGIKPTEPNRVDDPGTPPKKPSVPTEPNRVDDPGTPPSKVNKPIPPEVVSEPVYPEKYVPTDDEIMLTEALKAGTITEREVKSGKVVATAIAKKYYRNIKSVTLNFYSAKGGRLLVSQESEVGTYIEYNGVLPTEEVEGYYCEFANWEDIGGNFVDLNELKIDRNVDLYPYFTLTPRPYNVTWKVGDSEFNDVCLFGESPSFDESKFGAPYKQSEGLREFRFVGWKSGDVVYKTHLPPMKAEDVTFEAVFEASCIIEWKIGEKSVFTSVWKGEIPAPPTSPSKDSDEFAEYEFAGWGKEIGVASGDERYEAQFFANYFAFNESGHARIEAYGGEYIAHCGDMKGEIDVERLFKLAASGEAGVKLSLADCSISISKAEVNEAASNGITFIDVRFVPEKSFLFEVTTLNGGISATVEITSGGSEIYVDVEKLDIVGERAEFFARSGVTYNLVTFYSVECAPSDVSTVSVDLVSAPAGSVVTVSARATKEGMTVAYIYCKGISGEDIEVKDGSFVMPPSSVIVGAVCESLEFTVVFKSDGKVIRSAKYKYGEQIVPPPSPIKASDERFDYTFIRWDVEPGVCTADMEFNAVFATSPVKKEQISQGISPKIMIIVLVVSLIFVALVTTVLCLVVRRTLRKEKPHEK